MKNNSVRQKGNVAEARLKWLAVLTIGLSLVYLLGMGIYFYYLMIRTSEDAYATALWKRASGCARDIEHVCDGIIKNLEDAAAAGVEQQPSAPAREILAMMDSEQENMVSCVFRIDEEGRRTSSYPADGLAITPHLLASSNIMARTAGGLPSVSVYRTENTGRTHLVFTVPVFDGNRHDGMLCACVPMNAIRKRFLENLTDSLVQDAWISDRGKLLTGTSLDSLSRKDASVLRRESLIMPHESGPGSYAIVMMNDEKHLNVFARLSLQDTALSVTLSMAYQGLRLTPHALYKSSIILSAWILPLLVITIALTSHVLIVVVQRRERASSQTELEDTQARLIELIHIMPQAVYITFSYDDQTAFYSGRIEQITGYSAAELMANPKLWSRLIHQDYKQAVAQARTRLVEERKPFSIKYVMKHKSGEWIKVTEQASPVIDSEGNLSQIVGIISSSSEPEPLYIPGISENKADATETSIPGAQTKRQIHGNKRAVASPELRPSHGKARILFCDDDRLLVSLFTKKLQEAGYGITPAYNGLEAVELYSKTPEAFDVVVLDMVMPKMSGLEAIQHLRKVNPDIRIIGISGYSKDGGEWNLSKYGISSFHSKPFDVHEIVKAIEDLLEQGE